MNESGSVVEFFYNIVPGTLFLFLLKYAEIFDIVWISSDATFTIFAYIILSLLFGFIFQGMTKITRNHLGWNHRITKKVLSKNRNLDKFKPIYKNLQHEKYIALNKNGILDTFYLMDNSIRGEKAAFMPTHFSARFAFWSNILFALITLICLRLFLGSNLDCYFLVFVLLALISWYFADQYFEGFYDAILKSYYMKLHKRN